VPPLTPRGLVAWAKTEDGKRLYRYTATSVISVIVSEIVLFVALHFFSAITSNIIAVAVGTVPSYELNRKWAWGKSGKGHLWKEVVPFWALSFLGLVFSTVLVGFVADEVNKATLSGKLAINGTNLAGFGILWVGKFIIFNKILFAHHPEDLEPALDGRTGVPG
jgi:putative flippase GtrA